MVFQAVSRTCDIELVYGYGTGPDIMTGFHIRNLSVTRDIAYVTGLATAAQAFWEASVQPLQVDDLTLREIRVTDLHTQYGARYAKTVNLTGDIATAAAPSAVAALVHFNCDPGAAPRKGTLFHPGLAEAQIGVNELEAATVTAVQAAYEALREGADFDPADALVAVSRYSGYTLVTRVNGTVGKKPTQRDPALTNTIASVTVPARYGVQKKRRPSPL